MNPIAVTVASLALWGALWGGVVVLLGLGNTVGYHRLLTHRAFVTGSIVRAVLTMLGAVTGGSPVLWVGLHRLHHARSDSEGDPHTPRDGGFAWAHAGWLIGVRNPVVVALFALSGFGQQAMIVVHDTRRLLGRNPPTWRELCGDLMREPMMRALDTPGVMPALFLAQVALAWAVGGGWGLFGLWGVHLYLTNSSWAVNSISHWPAFGRQPRPTGDDSRDVPWMALPTLGEAWHNTHHRHPRSARHGLDGGLDPSWRVIQALCAVGLAEKPWLPKEAGGAKVG
jgi:stearoyl-CoA desaturase (delta-9 desaturase)